jgi:hypothetical protein
MEGPLIVEFRFAAVTAFSSTKRKSTIQDLRPLSSAFSEREFMEERGDGMRRGK